MNVQDFLTYLLEAIAFGYAALLLLDLGNCLGGDLINIFCSSPTTTPLVVEPATTKTIFPVLGKPSRTATLPLTIEPAPTLFAATHV